MSAWISRDQDSGYVYIWFKEKPTWNETLGEWNVKGQLNQPNNVVALRIEEFHQRYGWCPMSGECVWMMGGTEIQDMIKQTWICVRPYSVYSGQGNIPKNINLAKLYKDFAWDRKVFERIFYKVVIGVPCSFRVGEFRFSPKYPEKFTVESEALFSSLSTVNTNLLQSITNVAEESGNLAGELRKASISNQPISRLKVLLKLGSVSHHLVQCYQMLGSLLSGITDLNATKSPEWRLNGSNCSDVNHQKDATCE